ncbi:MAG: helix-turn-helix domain-containing protein [Geobacter sp.]|nr:helix-turn-helix domain-containing protein [Geobacter sp.]
MAEFSEILDSVAAKLKNKTECPAAPLVEKKARQEVYQAKPKNYVSKTAALGATEKILTLVKQCPEWGTKKIADALRLQEVSLSRQSIHKILLKYNLNRPAMRKAWQATQKEMNP